MNADFKLIDNFKLTGRLLQNFSCGYSEDDRIFIICDLGIYIIALRSYLENSFTTLSCKKYFFKPSNFAPSAHLGLDINTFIYDLPKDDLYESVLRTELSTELKSATELEIICQFAEWSPRGLANKTDCLIGVLTNLHSLELYSKCTTTSELEYCMVLNVTEEIIRHRKSEFKESDRLPGVSVKLNELKRRLEYVAPTVFTWSHMFNVEEKNVCAIFVGHFDGSISVWRIYGTNHSFDKKIDCCFLGRYTTQLTRICSLFWEQTTHFGGGLCIGDVEGRMSVLRIKGLNENEVFMDNEVAFCTEVNKMIDKITVMTFDNYTLVIVIKHSFLLFYGIDNLGFVFDHTVHDVENLYITGIHHYEDVLYVLTFTGVFKQLKVTVNLKKILVEEKIISLKLDLVRFRTHGFFVTRNKILLGLVTYPCRLRNVIKGKQFVNVFIYNNANLKPFEMLMKNSSGSLMDYWDCFEALRLVCLKEQRFPWLGLDSSLDYDSLSLLQLKTLRWVAKLSEMVFNIVPKVTNYDIKPYILLHYLVDIKLIVKRINHLINLKNSGKELTLFQLRSIDIQNFFLKEMVVKNILAKANVGKNFISEIRHVMSIANELKYPPMMQCRLCGEKIIGPLCLPPHADTRCSLSMMPIFLVPAYKCPLCKCLVHKEMEKEHDIIFCPYCDIPVEERCPEIADAIPQDEDVKSPCFDDCLKEEIEFCDIEENTNEYILFSDSEGEESEDDKLKKLYSKVAGMTLDDIRCIGTEVLNENGGKGSNEKSK